MAGASDDYNLERASTTSMRGQKCALVTGSSNGIGEAIVRALAQLDYRLVVTGRGAQDIGRVAGECWRLSPSKTKPLEVVADLQSEADVDRLFQESMEFFGQRLDLLVNNAGIGKPVEHTKVDECYETFKNTLQVNLNATARLTLLAAGPLKATARDHWQGRPTCIVNVSSIAAVRPTCSLAAYGTSKAAMCMYTNCMAAELAPLVRVNCLLPGPIETKIIHRSGFDMDLFRLATEKQTCLGRIGQPSEVAEAVLWLADSDKASYVTGAQMTVDGGASVTQVTWD